MSYFHLGKSAQLPSVLIFPRQTTQKLLKATVHLPQIQHGTNTASKSEQMEQSTHTHTHVHKNNGNTALRIHGIQAMSTTTNDY